MVPVTSRLGDTGSSITQCHSFPAFKMGVIMIASFVMNFKRYKKWKVRNCCFYQLWKSVGEIVPYRPKMPLSKVAGHAGTMATGVGDPRAASGGKCCHGVTAHVASSSGHLCCGSHLAWACCTSCTRLQHALCRHPCVGLTCTCG